MKWLVTWLVITWFSIPCPISPPSFDEFGRKSMSGQFNLIACYDTDTARHERYFNTQKEAKEFIKRAKASCEEIHAYWYGDDCDLKDFKIEEVNAK